MDVRVDTEQSTETARVVADPSGTLEPRQDQSDNEGQDQDLRNAPFACNVCKRSYSRVDHLARHHRSRGSPTNLLPRNPSDDFLGSRGTILTVSRHSRETVSM